MTLAISPSDTKRLFSASLEFNEKVQRVREDKHSSGENSDDLQDVLREAAKGCSHALVESFKAKDEADSQPTSTGENYWNIDMGLLFLLDLDKSIKLLVAFDLLGKSKKKSDQDAQDSDVAMKDVSKSPLKDFNEELADRLLKEDATTTKLLDRTGVVALFFSVLSAISVCVHRDNQESGVAADKSETKENDDKNNDAAMRAPTPTLNNKSPQKKDQNASFTNDSTSTTGDWRSSHETHAEIEKIATFAADDLMEFVNKGESKDAASGSKSTNNTEAMISFEIFGKWYNAGGFSLVPWLELLDLSKWYHHHHSNSTSPSKRSKPNEESYGTPGFGGMNEMIGSPTTLFAAGATVGADLSSTKKTPAESGAQSFSAMFGERNNSRSVIAFDFTGSENTVDRPPSYQDAFQINITEENLLMLQDLVRRTNLANLSPQQVEEVMMKHARLEKRKHGETIYIISRTQYNKFIRGIVSKEASNQFDPDTLLNFSNYFSNFFTCFDYSWSDLKKDEVNAKELMVGFSFLCAGNKSVKLAAGYEMLDVEKNGYLSQRGLLSYLRSYLTMLAGISLLSPSKKNTHLIRKRLMSEKRHEAFLAVENGAKWTLGHFLRVFDQEVLQNHRGSTRGNAVSFEDFAKWYTDGGYNIAPWLELLDLNKFLSLIGDTSRSRTAGASTNSAEVLFTFPLANNRSLVVLRDDALYVRQVVAELGLLSLTCGDIWTALYNNVSSNFTRANTDNDKSVRSNVEIDQSTFVQGMVSILIKTSRQKQKSQLAKTETTLQNLFSSFDMNQSNSVALNQLMCGLTMLCGGKKSNKLVFAFSLFDNDDASKNGKKTPALGYDDFFYFFRSFLIVMFSCCYQSLDLTAEDVGKYISDTARFVADSVMGYWRAKKVDKVAFEQFSEWYNEGGYEIIPWLELLDLNKWVLANHQPPPHQPFPESRATSHDLGSMPGTPGPIARADVSTPAAHTPGMIDTPASFAPSPNAEAFRALLASPKQLNSQTGAQPDDGDPLFDFDMSALDAEVDDRDFMLQHDDTGTHHANYTEAPAASQEDQNSLKFHLFSNEHHRGYIISIRPTEVSQLNRIVTETSLCQADASTVCNFILSESKSNRSKNPRTLSKRAFHAAMTKVCQQINQKVMAKSTKQELSKFLDRLYYSFDRPKKGSVQALEIACGITVLCGGRKSDKLEHVFDLFDEDKDSHLSQKEVSQFIRSFLVVLMSISSSISLLDGSPCSNNDSDLVKAIEAGSDWASTQVFEALKPKANKVCFDDFADWYTKGGYNSIPWLELLDLNKWVLGEANL